MKFLKRLFKSKEKRVEDPGRTQRIAFYSQFIQAGDLVFDIGANIGNRISAFLGIGAKVVAVEPQKECIAHLKTHFGNKIFLVEKGIGAEKGVKELHIADANTISSFSEEWIQSVKESGRFGEHKWEKKDQIEMITLNDLIAEYGLPKFIKIDVEGYEPEVLKGLSQKVNYISFEYAVPEQTKRCLECIDLIAKINPGAVFNYCIGEEMSLVLPDWIRSEQIVQLVTSQQFTDTGFGDIYVKMIP